MKLISNQILSASQQIKRGGGEHGEKGLRAKRFTMTITNKDPGAGGSGEIKKERKIKEERKKESK
jgi:hypothetical protein